MDATASPVVLPTRCKRCSRPLSSPRSRAAGYGRTCAARMTATLTAIGRAYSPAQIAAATGLISRGGLVVGPGGVCLATSSDGRRTYAVDPLGGGCTCVAGRHGRHCYHLCAAQALVGPAVLRVPGLVATAPKGGYPARPTPTQLHTSGPRRGTVDAATERSSGVECVRAAMRDAGPVVRVERAAVSA